MRTTIDTARRVKIADLGPGAVFRLHESDVTPHARIADDSAHLDRRGRREHGEHRRHVYSFYRGRIVEHDRDAIGLVTDLTRED